MTTDHPIAAGVWLIGVFGLIGYGAFSGLRSSMEHEKTAEKDELNHELEEIIEAGRREEYDVVIQRLEQLIQKHPEETGLYLNLGIALRATEKFDEADNTFAKVLELDPHDYDAMAERANIQKEKGNLDAALDIMEKIPVGEGRMNMRLREDPLWLEVAENPRVQALREKHGIGGGNDTSLEMQRRKEKNAAQGVAVP